MRAKKSLGQNFLKSPAVVCKMVEVAKLTNSDTVLEIGPGKGALTSELLNSGAKVIAIEKDTELIPILQKKFISELAIKQLTLFNADISTFDPATLPEHYKLIANIPYYITGEILRSFLESERQPSSMTLLVQKEVAQRIVARDAKESILSMSIKAYGEPKYVQKVSAMLFNPKPRVDSAVLHIANISKDFFITNNITEGDFFKTLKLGFSQKRKKLTNNLKISPDRLINIGIDSNVRAEDLSLDQWGLLSKEFTKML